MDGTSPSPPNHRRHWPRRSHGSRANEISDSDAAARRSPSPEPGPTTQQLLRRNSLGSSQESKFASAKTKALPTRRRAHFLKNWWLEIGACFIFVLALARMYVPRPSAVTSRTAPFRITTYIDIRELTEML